MKTYGGMELLLHEFLTSAKDGVKWLAWRSGCITHEEGAPFIHRIGGWLGPIAGLVADANRKNPCPY